VERDSHLTVISKRVKKKKKKKKKKKRRIAAYFDSLHEFLNPKP
jgi:hypothetical protein